MPAFPEFGEAVGEVRFPEVGHQFKAHAFTQPDGNVRVSGKIAVDLKGKSHGPYENADTGIGARMVKDLLHKKGQVIGNHNFFEKAPEYQPQSSSSLARLKTLRVSNWGKKRLARSMGPATNCGKKDTNAKNCRQLRVGSSFRGKCRWCSSSSGRCRN